MEGTCVYNQFGDPTTGNSTIGLKPVQTAPQTFNSIHDNSTTNSTTPSTEPTSTDSPTYSTLDPITYTLPDCNITATVSEEPTCETIDPELLNEGKTERANILSGTKMSNKSTTKLKSKRNLATIFNLVKNDESYSDESNYPNSYDYEKFGTPDNSYDILKDITENPMTTCSQSLLKQYTNMTKLKKNCTSKPPMGILGGTVLKVIPTTTERFTSTVDDQIKVNMTNHTVNNREEVPKLTIDIQIDASLLNPKDKSAVSKGSRLITHTTNYYRCRPSTTTTKRTTSLVHLVANMAGGQTKNHSNGAKDLEKKTGEKVNDFDNYRPGDDLAYYNNRFKNYYKYYHFNKNCGAWGYPYDRFGHRCLDNNGGGEGSDDSELKTGLENFHRKRKFSITAREMENTVSPSRYRLSVVVISWKCEIDSGESARY